MTISALHAWIDDVARLTRPENVYWCDGSEEEIERLYQKMVADGTLVRLDEQKLPNSFYARSHVHDVARVEDRTYICSREPDDAGPTNHWMPPGEMHALLGRLFDGCMRGRTMYVVPYLMGPPPSALARVGVQVTDSPYVVANMRIMTRMGRPALDALGSSSGREKPAADFPFCKGLHSTGRLDPAQRYISHFPEENLVMSFGSNYGGNALLAKKCFALRLASVMARREGWLAEHMFIVGITEPGGRKTYLCGAFPSSCGKTNLAMLIPPSADRRAGWKVETIGDDIAWLRFGPDGRLYAINPESGFFGVAPGTSRQTNPNALETCRANSLFTNVALLPDRTVWWEGLSAPPEFAHDWQGNPWTPDCDRVAAHPNSRFTAPAAQCPSLSPEWDNPQGVPISAIIFGGRRTRTMPLVYQAFNWRHGTYIGATMTSERTAAAVGDVGQVRHDPMAMLPFCGYHMCDYWRHWLELGRIGGSKMPAVFHVNWFRKDAAGKWLWPGFGANMRVLQWIVARCRGSGEAVPTPIGWVPTAEALDLTGLNLSQRAVEQLLAVRPDEWRAEAAERTQFLERFGPALPAALRTENEALDRRLQRAAQQRVA